MGVRGGAGRCLTTSTIILLTPVKGERVERSFLVLDWTQNHRPGAMFPIKRNMHFPWTLGGRGCYINDRGLCSQLNGTCVFTYRPVAHRQKREPNPWS